MFAITFSFLFSLFKVENSEILSFYHYISISRHLLVIDLLQGNLRTTRTWVSDQDFPWCFTYCSKNDFLLLLMPLTHCIPYYFLVFLTFCLHMHFIPFFFFYLCSFLLVSVSISCFFFHLSWSFNHLVASLKYCPSCAMEFFCLCTCLIFFQRNVMTLQSSPFNSPFSGIIDRSYQTLLMTETLGAQGCVTYCFPFYILLTFFPSEWSSVISFS